MAVGRALARTDGRDALVTRTAPWDVLVGEMLIRRLTVARIAPRLYPPTLPGTRATDADVSAARDRLGFDLDPQHEAVLREGDGWVDAFAHGDVLSTQTSVPDPGGSTRTP